MYIPDHLKIQLGQLRHRADITQVTYGPWTLKGRGQVRTQRSLLGDLDVSAVGAGAEIVDHHVRPGGGQPAAGLPPRLYPCPQW